MAHYAGFCHGVKRAVETVKKLKAQNPSQCVSILGELIHNTHVIQELESLGIKTLYEIPKHGEGICVIRCLGASPEVLEQIIRSNCANLIMVSCNAATLARDLQILVQNGYVINSIQPLDMFPRTKHVETIVFLCRKD